MHTAPPAVVLISTLWLAATPVSSQTMADGHAVSSVPASSCVDVTVNDHPALSYACLNQRLAASADAPAGPPLQLDAVTREPGNRQLGQFNFSAFSHRMGDSLGRSVTPQRPPPAPPPPLLGVPIGTH
ncbi:hypothetical protein GCM10007862_09470 [Dyella lipolytica]|uniref:Uncharacterized protein n=1 Tax=Dyella lipolytica TaxID=1867835 RepID=A0ABW8IZ70_9GAMM|nr:hypothetical protein [Dyella lipolytica]GLQ45896.1 hypothetical protein GCM10007862_09470 [Dyella lipolytica]